MRTRTKGIQLDIGGERIVNKVYKGQRIFERLGKVSQDEAERWLRDRQAEQDEERANGLRLGPDRLWADGAAKYLGECKKNNVASLGMIVRHVADLLPYIGATPYQDICNDALEDFVLDRMGDGVKNSTINRSLEVVRTTVIRGARVWRDKAANGRRVPWLQTAPLIEMLDEKAQARDPYPITWAQQWPLLKRLPQHLADSVEFSLNSGARDANVCGLRWEWEVRVPELGRSIFIIPAAFFKTGRPHVLVLNDVAWEIVERRRGVHPTNVFTWWNHIDKLEMPFAHQNNNAFQKARAEIGLKQARVHDLRHTYGQRLRAAGVPEEDRALLLGHSAGEGMSQHYAVATLERLLEAANAVTSTKDRTTVLRVVQTAARPAQASAQDVEPKVVNG